MRHPRRRREGEGEGNREEGRRCRGPPSPGSIAPGGVSRDTAPAPRPGRPLTPPARGGRCPALRPHWPARSRERGAQRVGGIAGAAAAAARARHGGPGAGQMMTAVPNTEMMAEQPTLEGIPEPNIAQEPPKEVKKGGRKRKAKETEPKQPKKPAAKKEKPAKSKGKQEKITDTFKVKRKVDRFNGVSEAELLTKTLPDILTFDLDIVIIGINPGLMAAYKGHHYPGPGNHFWKCLFMSGLSNEQLNHMDDHTLPHKYGIGFTNMVERTTPGSKDLSSKEFREGGRILMQKLQKYKPRIAAFNGKCENFYMNFFLPVAFFFHLPYIFILGIYEIFSKEVFGIKVKNLEFGLQPHKVPDTETLCYVMPSSSARCAQFPRAQDKVHYYIKLKDLRDQLKGIAPNTEVQEVQYTFDLQLAQEDAKKMAVKEEKYDPGYEAAYGGAYCDRAPYDTDQCGLSSNGTEGNPQYCEGSSFSEVPNGQWMTQSFADQIPEFSAAVTQEEEGSSM
ncbi:G/T mismatch-specific thymine DNA glycosylase isoform X2 [Onychostruthus taczanowskii]|uniref:G/T mismatch-specific thymine DNA glycosylase isoform X2 n=1 Tax=Onychostruthus taczanowskii TaxID=356909 RepID=UPI001B806D11|nr:G/T mismatch-specific thymine DNA glycosylase isoform X2 [Onychostruthus taczanowskii]